MINRLHGARAPEQKASIRASLQELVASAPGRLNGLRLDIVLTSQDGSASDAYVDVGLVHPTTVSGISAQAKFVHDCQLARLKADPRALVNELSGENSRLLSDAENKKAQRYAPIVSLATTFNAAKNKPAPVFFPALATHSGEISNGAMRLIEWLTDAYRHNEKGTAYFDGIPPKRRAGLFRQRLKDNLMVLIANGFGRTLKEAGMDRSIAPPPDGYSRC
jgi:hypothetical protein